MKTFAVAIHQYCSGVKFRANVKASSHKVAARRALAVMRVSHEALPSPLLHRPDRCEWSNAPERVIEGVWTTGDFYISVAGGRAFGPRGFYGSMLGWEDYK